MCVTQKLTKIVEPNEIYRKKLMSEVFFFSSPVFLRGYLPLTGDTNDEYRGGEQCSVLELCFSWS